MLFWQKTPLLITLIISFFAITPPHASADPLLNMLWVAEISNGGSCELFNTNQDTRGLKINEERFLAALKNSISHPFSRQNSQNAAYNYQMYLNHFLPRKAIESSNAYLMQVQKARDATTVEDSKVQWRKAFTDRYQSLIDMFLFAENHKHFQDILKFPPAPNRSIEHFEYDDYALSELSQRKYVPAVIRAHEDYDNYLDLIDETSTAWLELSKLSAKKEPLLWEIADKKFKKALTFAIVRQQQLLVEVAQGYAQNDPRSTRLFAVPLKVLTQQLPNVENAIFSYLNARGTEVNVNDDIGAVVDSIFKEQSIEGLMGTLSHARMFFQRNIYQVIEQLTRSMTETFANTADLIDAMGPEWRAPENRGVSLNLGEDGYGILRLYPNHARFSKSGPFGYGLPAQLNKYSPTPISGGRAVLVYVGTDGLGTRMQVDRYIVMRNIPTHRLTEASARSLARKLYFAALIYDMSFPKKSMTAQNYEKNPLYLALSIKFKKEADYHFREKFEAWMTREGFSPTTLKQLSGWYNP